MKKKTPTTKRKLTPNRAAAEVRHEIRRKMAELDRDFPMDTLAATKWGMLRDYIIKMAQRASRKKGGLGKQ